MNEKELAFKKSIEDKIEKYNIKFNGVKLTFRDVLKYGANKFVVAHYNNGDPDELIDIGIEKFLYKCSPYLFLDKYASFELPGIGEISCSNLYYFQKEILKDFVNYKKIVLTKSRQTGMSTLMSLIFFWKAVNFKSEWLVIISKDGKSSQDFLEKIKLNFKNIPAWFGVSVVKNNMKGVAFSNKTKIDSFARSKSAGRGTSPTMCILDEAAFYQSASIIEGIVSSVQPSLSRTGGSLFVVSTPNGTLGEGAWYYNQVRELQDCGGENKTSRLYSVDWWEVPDGYNIKPEKGFNAKLQSYVDRDYFNNRAVKLEADKFFRPIAEKPRDNDWLFYQFQTSGEVKYRQEILQDFVVLDNSVFDKSVIEKIEKKLEAPIITDVCNGYSIKNFWAWKRPYPDHKYILAVDVCRGSGNDDSCVQVLDMNTYEQVAEYSGKCTTIDLANYSYKIGEWYNWGFLVVESNSIGESTFAELYYNLHYPNLYNQMKVKDGNEIATGWTTTVKSRELITNNFIQTYYDDEMWKKYTPKSQRLLEQIKTWVWKGGRPDHLSNGHDDRIMAMAIALYNVVEGMKKVRNPDDIVFLAEDGTGINFQERQDNKLTNNYLNSMANTDKALPESIYRETEAKMYRDAGLPSGFENELKWLLS